jgi:hypothetical protein
MIRSFHSRGFFRIFALLLPYSICAVLFLLPAPSTGQSIKWSGPLDEDKQMKFLKIIGSADDNYFVLRSNYSFIASHENSGTKNRKYKLLIFSHEMVPRYDKVLASPVPDGRITDIQMVNGQLLASIYLLSKDYIVSFYLQYIDLLGNFVGTPVKVDEFNIQKYEDDNRPDLIYSKDETRIALAYRKLNKEQTQQTYRISVCDSALLPLFRKDIVVESGNHNFSSLDVALSDSGDIYLLGLQYTTDKKVKGPNESFYALYACFKDSEHHVYKELKSNDKYLTDAGLAVDNRNGAVVVAGFYSDQSTNSTAGVFYYAMKATAPDSGQVSLSPFSEAFLKKFLFGKKEGGKELVNYSIDRLLLRRDGGAVLVAESYNTYTHSYYDYFTQMLISHTYYEYGNILTLSVNKDGTLLWSDVLTKEHNSVDDEGFYSSYCSAVYFSKMYFIYNKFIDTKTSVMLSSVSGTGEQNTMVLFNNVENVLAVPKAAKQIDPEILLLPAYKDNQLCIAKIVF